MANPRITDCKIDIRDLAENMGNFNLVAYIREKHETGSYALIEDDTGCIKLNLQKHQLRQIQAGQNVKLSGVFTQVNAGFLEVFCWKDIEVIADI